MQPIHLVHLCAPNNNTRTSKDHAMRFEIVWLQRIKIHMNVQCLFAHLESYNIICLWH